MVGTSTFRSEWLDPVINPSFALWTRQLANNPSSVLCFYCKKVIDISTMGKQALLSHEKSKKHMSFMNSITTSHRISEYPSSKNVDIVVETDSQPVVEPAVSQTVSSPSPSSTLNTFIIKDSVISAEIRWALKTVASRFSFRSCSDVGEIFKLMFPDSATAQNFSMGKTKLAYTVAFGLAPHFKHLIKQCVASSDFIVLSFDEAFNKVAQKCQMDILVRFFDKSGTQTRYILHSSRDNPKTYIHTFIM